ncbi:MAG: GIY-YIG nuclease family protein [Archaeoglobaceae archaeon]
MPKKKRNYYRYELKNGRKKVYVGITKDPERRREDHKDNKRFTKMNVVGPAVTKGTAERWEEEKLKKYRKNHGGRNPRYNDYNR